MNDHLNELFRKTKQCKTEEEYVAVAKEAIEVLDESSDYFQFRGYYFLDVDNPFFDPDLSEEAWLQAVEANNWFAPWVMANHYKVGSFGRVDLENYRILLDLAADISFPAAIERQLSNALGEYTTTPEGSPEHRQAAEFIERIVTSFEDQITNVMPISYTVAQCYFSGVYVEHSIPKGIEILIKMARVIGDGSNPPPPSVESTFDIIRMSLFGFIDNKNILSEARQFLDVIPVAKGVNYFDLSKSLTAQKLKQTLSNEISAPNHILNRISECKNVLMRIWNAETDSKAQALINSEIRAGFNISDEIFLWYLEIIKDVDLLFRGRRHRVFDALAYRAEIAHLNVSWDDVIRNTIDEGISFNTVKDVLPIITNFDWPSEDGFVSIEGVEIDDGNLRIVGERSAGSALLFENDIIDALSFAYGWESCVWPSLSIEPIGSATADSNQLSLRRKVFSPAGFGDTDIGKTFFRADWLLAHENVFDPEHIKSENPNFPPDAMKAAKFLHDGFAGLGGVPVGLWGRVMLRPDNTEIVETHMKKGLSLFGTKETVRYFQVTKLDVFVDGAGCIDVDKNTSIRNLRQNDPRFSSGRKAKFFTDNMPLIKELLPVYARLEQLYRLMAVLGYMREHDVPIPERLRQTAIKRANEIAKGSSNDDKKMIVLP